MGDFFKGYSKRRGIALIEKILSLPRIRKQLLMLLADTVVLVSILLMAFSIRLGYWYWPPSDMIWVILGAPIIAIPIFSHFGLYRSVIRFIGFKASWSIVQASLVYALLWGVVGFLASTEGIPRSVILINWLLVVLSIGGLRMAARWLLNDSHISKIYKKSVLVYGAGSAGIQLVSALLHSAEYNPVGFIDDSKDLQDNYINGLKVYSKNSLNDVIDNLKVDEVLIALPSASRSNRLSIINQLEPYPVTVRLLPGVAELAGGKVSIRDLREISIIDLLGRDSVKPNVELLSENITDKVVMVTGAGGSIGSELCRQIVKLGVKQLILFEQGEFALYSINEELKGHSVELVPILGSVVNQDRLKKVCNKFCVQTIYHAAAYKHVPMVEFNNTEGVTNNVFGTLKCAQAAIECKVETFVLISTDKAVRPTNTMGATKRFAEMVLQALSGKQSSTKFTMVRFGNVLGSSGSVIPLFKKQIEDGGPVTVTDIEISRYFMTIPEAVELVIQAGALGEGGDVFVLDMGKPIRIVDLAKKMIRLSGLQIKDEDNPDGDIAIKYTGLRPGEKLYEELLIGDNVRKTDNPLIMRAEEEMLEWDKLQIILDNLELVVNDYDHKRIRELLIQAVPGFKPQCDIKDILFDE